MIFYWVNTCYSLLLHLCGKNQRPFYSAHSFSAELRSDLLTSLSTVQLNQNLDNVTPENHYM